jgi:hypothetical protein
MIMDQNEIQKIKNKSENFILKYYNIQLNLEIVPNKNYQNVIHLHAPINIPLLKKSKIYVRGYSTKIQIYLQLNDKIYSDNYDGGFYTCNGTHYILLLEKPILTPKKQETQT